MIGIHIKIRKQFDVSKAFKYAKRIGCDYIQMFNDREIDDLHIKKYLKKYHLGLVIHSSYIINIASNFEPHSWRTKLLLMEINSAIRKGAIGLVIHMGKRMTLSKEEAFGNMYQLLNYVCSHIQKDFTIFLETTAGQGTELCYKLDELSEFFSRVKKNKKMKNIKICLDTCHIFCAGYDIRTKVGVDNFIKKFDLLIGIGNIGLIHLNDSVNDIGTRKDRHTNIGDGFIGLSGLKYFYQYFSKLNIPTILETPIENYEVEINSLH